MSRYQLGPALGGDPPYCIVYDDLSPSYPIAVHGPNVVVAEERARELVARLNDRGFPEWVEIIEPEFEGLLNLSALREATANVIPIGRVRK
jgi:hypothetical protein